MNTFKLLLIFTLLTPFGAVQALDQKRNFKCKIGGSAKPNLLGRLFFKDGNKFAVKSSTGDLVDSKIIMLAFRSLDLNMQKVFCIICKNKGHVLGKGALFSEIYPDRYSNLKRSNYRLSNSFGGMSVVGLNKISCDSVNQNLANKVLEKYFFYIDSGYAEMYVHFK